ncbi:MAG: hypothetical protein CMJ39_04020 [Phycisphaerae bacterium]|nr:hypothetical protein [Phycisphaerae bacterium]
MCTTAWKWVLVWWHWRVPRMHIQQGENQPSLARLFEVACQLPTASNREALIRGLTSMTRWFVIDLGARDGILPLVCDHGAGHQVQIFTSAEAANQILKLQEELPASARVVSLPTHEVAAFISGLRNWGVASAIFNAGPWGISWSLDDLIVALWNYRPDSLPDIDALAAQANIGSVEQQARKLWSAVTSLPCWYFISDPVTRTDPMVGICRDQPCVLVFTDPVRARLHARMMDPSTDHEGDRLIALNPQQALYWFRSLATRGISGGIFNDGPCAFFIPMGRMTAPVDAVRSVA